VSLTQAAPSSLARTTGSDAVDPACRERALPPVVAWRAPKGGSGTAAPSTTWGTTAASPHAAPCPPPATRPPRIAGSSPSRRPDRLSHQTPTCTHDSAVPSIDGMQALRGAPVAVLWRLHRWQL